MTATAKKIGKWQSEEACEHVTVARRKMRDLGFTILNGGKFGLPVYDEIEVYQHSGRVVYFAYSYDGSWTVLTDICESNDLDATWEAIKAFRVIK